MLTLEQGKGLVRYANQEGIGTSLDLPPAPEPVGLQQLWIPEKSKTVFSSSGPLPVESVEISDSVLRSMKDPKASIGAMFGVDVGVSPFVPKDAVAVVGGKYVGATEFKLSAVDGISKSMREFSQAARIYARSADAMRKGMVEFTTAMNNAFLWDVSDRQAQAPRAKACEWLTRFLLGRGPTLAEEVAYEARTKGIRLESLRYAVDAMRVEKVPGPSGFVFDLPASVKKLELA